LRIGKLSAALPPWTVESVDPEAMATGVFGLDLGLGEGFEGDWEELPLCSEL